MDKKVFLLDREHYTKEQVKNLTEKDLEELVAEEDYTIIKIDANGYSTPEAAIEGEAGGFYVLLFYIDDYYVIPFGF